MSRGPDDLEGSWLITERPPKQVKLSEKAQRLRDQLQVPGAVACLVESDVGRAKTLQELQTALEVLPGGLPLTISCVTEPASTVYLVHDNVWETLALLLRTIGWGWLRTEEGRLAKLPAGLPPVVWAVYQQARYCPGTLGGDVLSVHIRDHLDTPEKMVQSARSTSCWLLGSARTLLSPYPAATREAMLSRALSFLRVVRALGLVDRCYIAFDAICACDTRARRTPALQALVYLLEKVQTSPELGISVVLGWTGAKSTRDSLAVCPSLLQILDHNEVR